ncbi:putative odorant receptor 85d [Hyposmocoma kahamanoa]|uniref:putative odorant receptor 85d n=1 Tax=Hyposmocoma kahamanoa TaxID=1477025 RepID=UPI000E6D6C26|nr:putative odorant receptor 85d [Hyposmocoma kahamanoa]
MAFQKRHKILRASMCLDRSIAILKCAGVWMPDLDRPWNLCYTIFACLLQFFLFFCIVLAEVSYVFTVMDDTNRTIEATVLLFTHIIQGVKVLTIVLRQGRIKRLIKFIDGPDFTTLDPQKHDVIEKTINIATIIEQAILGAVIPAAMFWCIVPAFQSDTSLPLKTVFPFDWKINPMFAITYVYTSISVTVLAVSDAAENFVVSGLMIMGSAQLDVLSFALQNIGRNENNADYEETITCIKHHQNIIKYVNELAEIFGTTILCQFITSSIVVCMTLFKITLTTEAVEMVTIIFYLLCIFVELLMYCYPGDLLINKSLLISEAAFPNNWSGDIRSRQALLLTALRAQKALLVNAGGVLTVSLPTAAAVVRSAYSYYTVLRQKMNDN